MHESWEEARAVGFSETKATNPAPISQSSNSKLQKLRCSFFLLLSGLSYAGFTWMLFVEKRLLRAAGIFCILFIELIFLAIDLRKVKKKQIWITMLLIGAGISPFILSEAWQLIVVLWFSLFMIWFLIFFLGSYFQQVRKVNWISYFSSGGYLFTMMTAIMFGFAVLGINSKFPFQCEQISWRSEKIIKTSTFSFGKNETQPETEPELPLREPLPQDDETGILKAFRATAKSNVIDGVMNTQKSINQKVCEAIIGQVEKVYQHPVFQIGAVFGMYLLFYGVIRLFVRIITMIGYILFWITRRFGLYKVEKKLQEVDEVL